MDLFNENSNFGGDNDEDLFNDNSEEYPLKIENSYKRGDIVYGKVGSYPWWPCMICHIPESNDKENMNNIFVKYFGREEVSWLYYKKVMTPVEYLTYQKSKKEVKNYRYYYSELVGAENEAKYAKEMDLKSRLLKYFVDYETLKMKKKYNKSKCNRNSFNVPKPVKLKIEKKKEVIYAFSQLDFPSKLPWSMNKCCRYCLVTNKRTVKCKNTRCVTYFHEPCLSILQSHFPIVSMLTLSCFECLMDYNPCFVCSKVIEKDEDKTECSMKLCNKMCHFSCLEDTTLSEMTRKASNGKLVCPRHICHKCEFLDRSTKCNGSTLIHCIMCVATYHTGDWCIPAGCIKLSERDIICLRHLPCGELLPTVIPPYVARVPSNVQSEIYGEAKMDLAEIVIFPPKKNMKKNINVNWCFKCGTNGELICCESCPAAYHFQCANITKVPEHFYCMDCRAGNYHTYGEIVLIKYGVYQWWPAQIMHQENVPDKILQLKHKHGQFVVQFFGTQEYLWTDQSVLFSFEEEDKNSLKNYKKTYNQAIAEACKGIKERELKWNYNLNGIGLKCKRYINIKTNRRFGSAKKPKTFCITSYPKCECDYFCSTNNCNVGSSCLNLNLNYECHPDLCAKKEKCQNRNFVQRNYPKQEIFNSDKCGWGLKTKEFIRERQFVNEYVGEIINNDEFERRQEWAKENNITDFYFMKLDADRFIDARECSNLARFINHSCDPNLVTERWNVHEDIRIGLFALRDIGANEELTFNYNIGNQLRTSNMFPCLCGSLKCSGFLGPAPKNNKLRVKTKSSKKLKSLSNKENIDLDTEENMCKGSMSTSMSTISLSTLKNLDRQCFRCSEDCNEQEDLCCSFEHCDKIYHSSCLEQSQSPKYPWFCPWHFCNSCGLLSDYFCQLCIVSCCKKHLKDYGFREISADEGFICISHDHSNA